jgi:hypothetical protein
MPHGDVLGFMARNVGFFAMAIAQTTGTLGIIRLEP